MKRKYEADSGDSAQQIEDSRAGSAFTPSSVECPYLATVNRGVLDFDMEKLCCVTLSNMNVYCCLVCGKYYAGRGKSTPAYTHSVQHGHFVFLNLQEQRFYCLPDTYEIKDASLADIKSCLSPNFSEEEVAVLDTNMDLARDVGGSTYLPGFLGINNLGKMDYVTAAIRALSHVKHFRNFFLETTAYTHSRSQLTLRLGECMRRLWSRWNFKGAISPQELINAISTASLNKFATVGVVSTGKSGAATSGGDIECVHFLSWFLNELHKGLCSSPNGVPPLTSNLSQKSSIVSQCFQGLLQLTEQTRKAKAAGADELDVPWQESVRVVPFQHLSLDIPPPPLFQEGDGEMAIPQVPIFELLKKFDGKQWTEALKGDLHVRRKYQILRLPPYLILHLVRITDKTGFRKERNPTIVSFPLRNLDVTDIAPSSLAQPAATFPAAAEIAGMSVAQLKSIVCTHGTSQQQKELRGCDKSALVELARRVSEQAAEVLASKSLATRKYNLLANICRESTAAAALQGISVGAATESTLSRVSVASAKPLRVHLQHKPTKQWFELEDLHVSEVEPTQVGVSEASVLIYEAGVEGS